MILEEKGGSLSFSLSPSLIPRKEGYRIRERREREKKRQRRERERHTQEKDTEHAWGLAPCPALSAVLPCWTRLIGQPVLQSSPLWTLTAPPHPFRPRASRNISPFPLNLREPPALPSRNTGHCSGSLLPAESSTNFWMSNQLASHILDLTHWLSLYLYLSIFLPYSLLLLLPSSLFFSFFLSY